ncbi:MAG TPA: replicative DNA helicase [Polyangia bacterium]|jgi:replicative DNA helicase|nr:replicative DNA helicase [Polyangia bacterium]
MLELASSSIAPSARTPPHNLDAEKSVLGGVLVKPAAFDDVATTLQVDDFFLPAHREIFEAMLELDRRRHPLDVIAVADELKTRGMLPRLEGGETYLLTLANAVPTAENIPHYARLVKEKATLRRLIAACAEIQSSAYADFGDFELFLDEAETRVFKVAQQNRRESYSAASEMMEEVLHNIEVRAAERKAVTGVPTGFTKLDEYTAGLQRENLIIVAARPGGGKTSWAVNVAVNAAMKKIPVLIFSLEMSKYELMERMLAGEARIDSSRIKRGFLEYSDWKNKIHPASGRLAEAPILIDDSSAISIMEIRAKARRFRGDPKYFPAGESVDGRPPQPPLGLIVVDYLQLARGSTGKRDENRQQEIAEISRGLKALAKDLKIPIIAVSQLNREVEKREGKPKLSDLRESGAIEQDADLILFIHREDMQSDAPEAGPTATAEIIIGKHRNGATGAVKLTFIKEYTKFENHADEPEY